MSPTWESRDGIYLYHFDFLSKKGSFLTNTCNCQVPISLPKPDKRAGGKKLPPFLSPFLFAFACFLAVTETHAATAPRSLQCDSSEGPHGWCHCCQRPSASELPLLTIKTFLKQVVTSKRFWVDLISASTASCDANVNPTQLKWKIHLKQNHSLHFWVSLS